MVPRALLMFALVAPALTLAPGVQAQATQAFHYAPENGFSLVPVEALDEPLSTGTAVCAAACVRHQDNSAWHETRLTQGGLVLPVNSHFWVEVRQPTVTPPAEYGPAGACAAIVYVEIYDAADAFEGGWYYCAGMGGLAQPGLYEFDLDWSGIEAIAAEPGSILYSSIWTFGSSQPESQSLFLVSDVEHPSRLTVSGTSEPVPVEGTLPQELENETAPPPTATTTTSKPPKPSSSSTSTAPEPEVVAATTSSEAPAQEEPLQAEAKASPAVAGLLVVGLGLAALVGRRRL